MKDHPINPDGPRLPALLVFDVNETLSDMSPLAARFEDVGAPAHLAQTWFAIAPINTRTALEPVKNVTP